MVMLEECKCERGRLKGWDGNRSYCFFSFFLLPGDDSIPFDSKAVVGR